MFASLEGGLVANLDESIALRMKSCTIHEVDTDFGGFIVTKAYIDESALAPMSRWLAKSPHALQKLDDELKGIALHNWISSARLATSEQIFDCWQVAGRTILSVLMVHPMGKKSICAFLREIHRSNVGAWAGEVLNELKAK